MRWFHESGTYLRSAEECAVMDQLGQGRARAGYTVSFPISVPRSKGAMGLARAAGATQAGIDAPWQAKAAALMALAHVTYLKLSQMPLPVDGARLTVRQREMLEQSPAARPWPMSA